MFLPTTACRLHHLVMCAAARIDEALAKAVGAVLDEIGRLKAPQIPVIVAGAEAAVFRGLRVHAPHLAKVALSD
jgi:hypothetical protein